MKEGSRFDCGIALCMLVLFMAAPVQAVEVTPFAGERYGGSFEDTAAATNFKVADAAAFGLVLDFDLEPDNQFEVLLSRQNTNVSTAGTFTGTPLFDLTIDYYHIGGLYMFPEEYRVRPFLTGTFGLARMDPKRADLTTENHFSLSLGGGAKYFFTKTIGLRFDVRIIYTMLDSETAIFCSGGCIMQVNSSGFTQTEAGAALMMRF